MMVFASPPDRAEVMLALKEAVVNHVCSDRSFRFGAMPKEYRVSELFTDVLSLLTLQEKMEDDLK